MTGIQQGKRFSHLYISRGMPQKDSSKARYRLGKLLEKNFPLLRAGSLSPGSINHTKNVQKELEYEIGRQFATGVLGGISYSWGLYTEKITVSELLDTITIVFQYLEERGYKQEIKFATEANRIFSEENLAYTVDEAGGVHPLVDAAFDAANQSAIAALMGDRHAATVAMVDGIDACLLKDPADYIGAIRAVFGANENLFNLMFGVPQLHSGQIRKKMQSLLQAQHEGHPTRQRASAMTLKGFESWVDAAHNYRHEQGAEIPSQPTEELGILLISQGLSYVRWLAQIDKLEQEGTPTL